MVTEIRVLYVDDEASLLELCKVFLERSGDFTVTTALSAPEAIRMLEKEKFDVIVSDYQMPEMDGIEFLKRLKAEGNTTPFIIFTGKGREEVAIEALNAGADGYLQKGGDSKSQFAELSQKIKQAASRKRADDSLRKSEEKYRHLIEHANEAIVVVQDRMLKLVNHRTVEFTGYLEQELLSMPFSAVIHPDDRAMVVERYQKRMNGEGPPSRYAFRLSSKDGSTRWVEISVVAIDWEGQPATLNFLTDITERKLAEEALRESEARYRALFDGINNGVAVYEVKNNGKDFIFKDFNRAGERIDNDQRERLIGKSLFAMRPGVEQYGLVDVFRRVWQTGKPEYYPVALYTDKQLTGWYENYVYKLPSGEIVAVFENVTDRKKAEESLRESEEQFRRIVETSLEGIWQQDAAGRVIYVNDTLLHMIGYTREEMIGKPVSEFLPENERDDHEKRIASRRTGKSERYERKILQRDGSVRTVLISASPVFNAGGVYAGAFAMMMDITERKRAEVEIARLASFPQLNPAMVFEIDPAEQVLFVNPAMQLTMSQLGLSSPLTFIPEDVHKLIREWDTRTRANYDRECSVADRQFLVSIYLSPEYRSIRFYLFDITERKRADEALRAQSILLTSMINSSSEVIIFSFDREYRYLAFNEKHRKEMQRVWKTDIRIGMSILDCMTDPVLRQAAQESIDRTLRGDAFTEIQHQPDPDIWYEFNWSPIRQSTGEIMGGTVFIRDITERKAYEESLRQSEERYRALVDHALEAILIFDFSGTVLFANHATAALVEVDDPLTLTGRNALEFIAPESRDTVLADFASVMGGRDAYLAQYKVVTATGREKWVESIGKKIQFGGVPADIVMLRDITDRKQAEFALRESEGKYRTLVETTGTGFVIIDDQGRVLDANLEYVHLTGHTSLEEIAGRNVIEWTAAHEKDKNAAAVSQCMRDGYIRNLEIDYVNASGTIIPIEINATVLRSGDAVQILTLCRDITERKRDEEALRQANKQLNLLSSITRHDIKNQLMTLKGYIELSREYLDDKKTLSNFLGKEETAARTIEDQITFTKDYQDLGAAAPAWQSVNASIKKALTGLPMRAVRVEVDPKNPAIFADPLFEKVFYNLIDNALRYGGDQMKTIRVSSQESDTSLAIVCENDGVGITAEDKKRLFTRGFGKNTGLGLFLSREILAITGITITENGVPGKGARFKITVPKGAYRFTGTG